MFWRSIEWITMRIQWINVHFAFLMTYFQMGRTNEYATVCYFVVWNVEFHFDVLLLVPPSIFIFIDLCVSIALVRICLCKMFSIPINWINVCSSVWAQTTLSAGSIYSLIRLNLDWIQYESASHRIAHQHSKLRANLSNISNGNAFARLNISLEFLCVCLFVVYSFLFLCFGFVFVFALTYYFFALISTIF